MMYRYVLILVLVMAGLGAWRIFTPSKSARSTSHEKPIVVVIPSYNNEHWCLKNISSILEQRYSNFRIVYIDDCSTDATYELVRAAFEKAPEHIPITFIKNKHRKGALANLYHTLQECADHEIAVLYDGDDWAPHSDVLARINQEYQDPDVWMTYGQFKYYPANTVGFCSALPSSVIEHNWFRKYYWVTSHLRTFYVSLFKKIKYEDLLYEQAFFDVTWDQAIVFPLLEMAKYHVRFISDVLYVYNQANPLNDGKLRLKRVMACERFIRQLPRYITVHDLTLA